jgi:hypothetical protein
MGALVQAAAGTTADPIAKLGLAIGLLLTIALLVVPPIVHLWTGWSRRRDDIVGQLSKRGIALYFKQFRPASRPKPGESDETRFEREYGVAYGRRHYVYPLALLTGTGVFLLWLVLRYGVDAITKTGSNDLPVLAVAAIAGAYFWVVLDLVRRCHGRDLAPLDLNRASLRMAVAIPIGYTFTATFGDSAVWLAFLLGALPLDTLTMYARRLVNARLNVNTDDPAVSDVTLLDGVTKASAEQLRDAGVSTINQLALSDPIDLSIRTNLPMTYVTDCVSQALAFDYLKKDGMDFAQKYFLRGAVEINTLVSNLKSACEERSSPAKLTLKLLAADLKMDQDVLRQQLEVEISGDTHTQFLADLQLANTTTDVQVSRFSVDTEELPADGVTVAELTVWLRTKEGRDVRGEPVNITCTDHDVVILPDPIARTDEDGKVHFKVRSKEPGKATFSARDTLEELDLVTRPTVTFVAIPKQVHDVPPVPAPVRADDLALVPNGRVAA